ncbi:MAG: hypothetical protein DRP74_02300 [Candidatus Omnitrophota bacterium]|nr:MAG: hypothetical protein DRP74_02300 [Candidatus Omnitrophota bacterium]
MKKIDVFDVFANGFSYTWKHHLIHGLLLLGFGLAVLFFPQLLVAMVASLFIIIGISFIGFAFSIKRFSRRYNDFRDEIFTLF